MNILAMTWPQALLGTLIIVVCLLLMLVVLIQRGRGGGLSGAFGGTGGTAAFGAKTGDVFTWITVTFGGIFFLLVIVANFAFDESPQAREQQAATAGTTETPAEGPGAAPVNVKTIKIGADGKPIEDGQSLPIEIVPTPAPSGQAPDENDAAETEPAPADKAADTAPKKDAEENAPAEKPKDQPNP